MKEEPKPVMQGIPSGLTNVFPYADVSSLKLLVSKTVGDLTGLIHP